MADKAQHEASDKKNEKRDLLTVKKMQNNEIAQVS